VVAIAVLVQVVQPRQASLQRWAAAFRYRPVHQVRFAHHFEPFGAARIGAAVYGVPDEAGRLLADGWRSSRIGSLKKILLFLKKKKQKDFYPLGTRSTLKLGSAHQ
jgi:hypothetical protein